MVASSPQLVAVGSRHTVKFYQSLVQAAVAGFTTTTDMSESITAVCPEDEDHILITVSRTELANAPRMKARQVSHILRVSSTGKLATVVPRVVGPITEITSTGGFIVVQRHQATPTALPVA